LLQVLELAAREVLESLISIVEEHPSFMRPYLEPAAAAMLTIAKHDHFDHA
jgi:hypothetical protein